MVESRSSVSNDESANRRAASPLSHEAFADLFQGLREGIYIGLVGPDESATLAANPHLRTIFGWPDTSADGDVRPLDPDRFVDEQARADFLALLRRDASVRDWLLRLRRVDGTAMWVEVTARAAGVGATAALRVEAMMRDVSDR
jgi:PAS domain-containing protein